MRWIALLLACSAHAPDAQSETMIALPPFQDPQIQPVYNRLSDWAGAQGWASTPLKRRGSRLERTWTRGLAGKGELPGPGGAQVALSVFASSKAEHAYGIQWSAGVADEAGHGLHLFWASGATGVTTDQFRIDLWQDGGGPTELGAPLHWKVGERALQTSGPSGLAEVQTRLDAYLVAFSQAAAADLSALDALVSPVLDRGDYTVCDYGPSPGKGIPGPCLPRAPTTAEREANKAKFAAEMERRRRVLASSAPWSELLGSVSPPL